MTTVTPDDRVLLYPVLTCGRCRFSRNGPENQCRNLSLYHGAFAERAVVRAADLVSLPDSVDPASAAAFPSAYVTAWRMLDRAGVTAGDRVLVPGGTGGVGVVTVYLAGVRGATTVGTSRSSTKADRLSDIGADRTIVARDSDELAATVADRGPFDVVVDHLGGEYVGVGLDALRTGGTMVLCGGTAGMEATISVPSLYRSHARILGSSVGTKPDLERVLGLVQDRDLSPVVDREYPLTEAERAFRALQVGDAVGKIVLRP